jgi:hypothetical protein
MSDKYRFPLISSFDLNRIYSICVYLSVVFHIQWSDGARWNLTLGLFHHVVKCVNLCGIGTSLYKEV